MRDWTTWASYKVDGNVLVGQDVRFEIRMLARAALLTATDFTNDYSRCSCADVRVVGCNCRVIKSIITVLAEE